MPRPQSCLTRQHLLVLFQGLDLQLQVSIFAGQISNCRSLSLRVRSPSSPPMAFVSETSSITFETPKKGLISCAFSGNPTITSEKLNGKNFLDWHAVVDIWFLSQGLSEHLTKQAKDIPDNEREQWQRVAYQLVSLLWQSIDPKLLVHFRSYKTCYDI